MTKKKSCKKYSRKRGKVPVSGYKVEIKSKSKKPKKDKSCPCGGR